LKKTTVQQIQRGRRILYKYFKMRGPRAEKKEGKDEGEEEDSELEDFANDLIKKEMKKMNAGADALEDEDEDF
jgi:hypothetical protein